MRTMALDVGNKRTGVALSDPLGILATPLTVIQSKGLQKDIEEVVRLAQANDVESILVGIPLSMDGVAREQAQRTERFSEALRQATDLPIIHRDERLTTVEAQRRLREQGVPSRKGKEGLDAVAAAILLQSYLDSRPTTQPEETV